MKSDFIWMDGKLVPYEDATIHFINPTLHYGVGVFEGVRCYNTSKGPAVFRLVEHLNRMIESTHIMGVPAFPYTTEELRTAVHQTILANGFTECYIRPLVYLKGPMGMNMDRSTPAVGIACWEWGPYLGVDSATSGIHMMVASFTRLHPNIAMTKAKITGNYVNSLMTKTLALRSGYDEAVLLDPNGYVAECTGENIFMVRKGILYTPSLASVLEGLTRDTVITLARDLNIRCKERPITRDMLYTADEVFITGTAAELVPVRMIDFRQVGDGARGPITRALSESFRSAVHGEGPHTDKWLDFVK